MTDTVAGQDKKAKNAPKVKSPAEKYLEDKKNAALGISPSNQFGSSNSRVNRPGFAGNAGGGKSPILKHSRSR